MQRTLIVIGLLLLLAGLVWPWLSRLGRLPGDIVIERPGFSFSFPLTTCIIVSVGLSLIGWLSRK